MTLDFFPFFSLLSVVLPIYLVLRRPWRYDWKRETLVGVFALYFLFLLFLTLRNGTWGTPLQLLHRAQTRLNTMDRINLRPFFTIRLFFHPGLEKAFLINVVGNVVMFLPFGFFLPLLWKQNRSLLRLLLFPLLLTVTIESIQLLIGRQPDMDDVMLNALGGYLGEGLFFLLKRMFPAIEELQK